MKIHSTNYINTLIEVSEDCPEKEGIKPPVKANNQSIANLQYNLLFENPYKYTSDDVLFGVYAKRKNISENNLDSERQVFFSKGQPCFRASPLTKRYGWGIHSDSEGKIALVSYGTEEYNNLVKNDNLKVIKAMRNKRK